MNLVRQKNRKDPSLDLQEVKGSVAMIGTGYCFPYLFFADTSLLTLLIPIARALAFV